MYNGLVKSVRHIQVKRISFHPKLFEAIITYQPHPTESDESDELETAKLLAAKDKTDVESLPYTKWR